MELMDRSDAQGIAGTVLLGPAQWPAINWRKVAGSVHRLQARIAKATREGRRGKAHALQRILTRSLGAACWAVRRVTTNKGKRTLGIPCMKDRAKQAVYALALEPIAECLADPNSYGFRRGRSTADAIEQCFIVLARRVCAPWVLEGDITACYDRISHEWLGKHVPMDKGILSKWLKSGYVEPNALHATHEGTPQGGLFHRCCVT